MTTSEKKHIEIEFLYLDLETCSRCKGTDQNLTTAITMAQTLLEAADARVTVRKTLVDSEQKAIELGFEASPTIRVNGHDVAMDLHESQCTDCSDLCGYGEEIACRVWRYKGQDYDVAPVPVLLNAIMSAVYSSATKEAPPVRPPAELPDNLQKFFARNREMAEACCSPETLAACCAPEDRATCCEMGTSVVEPATCGCR